MTIIRRQLGSSLNRLRISHFQREQLRRETADRQSQEHIQRLTAGIKDFHF
ncbi:MAG: hypothetical protein ACRDPG_06460 [Nocardioidaceae bacterium]